ncbi:DUF4350 domain-containing protein [Flavobacterium sp. C4GT6]|uniref:DUF4350 domain-containing protein n=1 Tax=Flavobacterium sp. C4GT6 TaxID=3103818 RepID=UPI002ED2E811
MKKSLIIYMVLFALVIALIMVVDANKPEPISWRPSYKTEEKIPLGLYVFDKEAKTIFKDSKLKKFSVTPYEYITPLYDYDIDNYTEKGTFINIDVTNKIDNESVQELLYFAEYGSTVFLSMQDFPKAILDSLKIETSYRYYSTDSLKLTLADKTKNIDKLYYSEGVGFTYFDKLDTLNTLILGYQRLDKKKDVNFIKVPYGNGAFILHTQPAAFTNFHLLKNNHYHYAEQVLSYLPQGNIYWHSKSLIDDQLEGSALRYFLKQPAFKAVYRLGLLCLFIFIFFNARRKQRIVHDIPPVKNTTIDFTKTIGNLYYQERNHHTIIQKKIIYFLEHIRTVYLIDTSSLNNEFVEKLHQKTGKPLEDIEKAVSLIKRHRNSFESSEADVIQINKAIEKLIL